MHVCEPKGEVPMHQIKQGESQERQAGGVRPPLSDQFSDEHLLTAMASGAIWALEVLYQRSFPVYYALASHLVTNPQVAEDLIQEAFFAIWQQAGTYSPHAGAAKSWLTAIVRNRCIDYLRAAHRRALLQEAARWEAEQEESQVGP